MRPHAFPSGSVDSPFSHFDEAQTLLNRMSNADAITCADSECSSGDAARKATFAKALPGHGIDFEKAVKSRYSTLVALHPYGEVLPATPESDHGGKHSARSLWSAGRADRI